MLLSYCSQGAEDLHQLDQLFDYQVEQVQGVRTIYSDSAHVKVVIESPLMLNYIDPTDPRQEFPEGLQVTFFDEQEAVNSTLTAQWGQVDQREARVTVRDSVVWQSVKQEMLETEELIWDQRDARIHTNKFVVVTQPDTRIYGYGFEAPQDFSRARIKQVTGRIPINPPDN